MYLRSGCFDGLGGWAARLRDAVEASRPENGALLGATDGSQLGRKGAYGWMMIYQTPEYTTSGKDDEPIKEDW